MPPTLRILLLMLSVTLVLLANSAVALAQTPVATETLAQPAVSSNRAADSSDVGSLRISREPTTTTSTSQSKSGLPSLITVFGSLGAVLAAFFVLAWLMKRGMPKNMGTLPKEVVEVLGRAPLAQRQHVHLLRCGNRLLLVSVTPAGAETLSEITDPMEVDRLTGLCAQQRSDSVTASFRQVFHQFGREKSASTNDVPDSGRGQQATGVPHARAGSGEGLHA